MTARIEPLDPARHDRASFASGVRAVDNFLRLTAAKLARADNLRVHVLAKGERILGFHAVNAHAVDWTDLPPAFARDRPGHGGIPAAFIAMMGVDARAAGRGLGGLLLADALGRIAAASRQVGIRAVLLDVLDDGDAAEMERRTRFYERHGFQGLPSRPGRMFLPVATVRRAMAVGGSDES